MTAVWLTFAILAVVLGAFALKKDSYSSPPVALALSIVRAAVVALLFVLALPRPQGGPPPPRLLVLMDQESQTMGDTPRRLAALAARSRGVGERVAFYAAGPPRTETPSLHEDLYLGHPLARFPNMGVTLEAARWEAARGGTCRVIVLAGSDLPLEEGDFGATGLSVMTVWAPILPAIRAMVMPSEGFSGTPIEVRLELVESPKASMVEVFVDNRSAERRPLRDRKGRFTAEQTFLVELPPPGPHVVSALIRDAEGQIAHRRSAPVNVQARPRILYVSPPGLDSPLRKLLTGRSFEVERYTMASLPGEGSPLAKAGSGDLVILDSPSQAFLGAPILASATEAVFNRGASLLVVAGDALREGDRGAALERIWPARLGMDRPETEDRVLALVAILDTSMSMAFQDLDSGHPARKIDMAKLAVSKLAHTMRDKDLLGVLGSDFNPYWVVDLKNKRDPLEVTDLVGRIVAFGPGINLYSSLLAALEGLEGTEADIKHVIVLADTADIDEVEVAGTGTVWDLLKRYNQGGITISIVGFGGSDEAHVPFLNRFTEASGGFLYLASTMADVPGFFLEDLEQVGDSLVVRGHQNVVFRQEEFPALKAFPPLEGQVLVTPKPGAGVLTWTERDYPLLSTWRVGRGSVGFFASDNGGLLAAGWASEEAGPLWDSLIAKMLPSDPSAQVFADVARGKGRIFVRIRAHHAQLTPVTRWFRPGGEPLTVGLERTAPFEYSTRVPDLGYGSHLLEVRDSTGLSPGPLATLSIPIEPAGSAPDQEANPGSVPPTEKPSSHVPWSDPRIFRLLLLLAVGLLVIDELFRAP